ncbi:MarR family winged helix-turn-helix transcriptional regulator [Domibacillus enclensis]|uniref:HTH-type transcriptional regulator SarZ n=1 Tax=Domibacillus enclensis TaxID=1017273 RepID=A0A1N6TRW0_9BACI|nr:MarR family transcriptional regulator [Domibacillus enclensis]OXS78336.1 MarR family transcriptional regulator [Domibacillus enclensis]SIQ55796.1 accessory regulator family [Domibacillus enclensis]
MKDFLSLNSQLCFAVYETASEFTKLYASVLQPFGLTYTQYLVLLSLWEKDAVTMKELGARLHLGTGTLTPMISRMQENGWIQKRRSTEDERKVFVYLEDKARQQQMAITQKVAEEIQLCNIQVEEYNELMKRLNDLHHKLQDRTDHKKLGRS